MSFSKSFYRSWSKWIMELRLWAANNQNVCEGRKNWLVNSILNVFVIWGIRGKVHPLHVCKGVISNTWQYLLFTTKIMCALAENGASDAWIDVASREEYLHKKIVWKSVSKWWSYGSLNSETTWMQESFVWKVEKMFKLYVQKYFYILKIPLMLRLIFELKFSTKRITSSITL